MVAVAFILATSVVEAVAPSSRSIALGAFRPSTTSTVTLYPSARHFASASCAMLCATSIVRTRDWGSCAKSLVESAAMALIVTASLVHVMLWSLLYKLVGQTIGLCRLPVYWWPPPDSLR